ncbi:MFS transporter [Sinorhizobium numidicum]|uniref:MFS transporter n=1 Tax=Sinorhizobium numidicum TaxID=680248 RepID=A0ABY8CV30_9HYPH|nr:MFS transporter [Sinorhizobium numidicum]WEX75846.1 MFS transporter [Sinorhizobium numidicum]WEX82504.1 MFS transporter [Sinorhizobium numidicum]
MNSTAEDDKHGSVEQERAQDWREILSPGRLAATATLCLGVALFAFNEFFISTSLPTAVAEFGGAALLSWAFTLYLVFAILGGTLAANLKLRFGARNSLVAAAVVFSTGTLIATFAANMPTVLAGRIFQGLGEGIVAATCYSLIPELFPKRLVPKVFGAEAIVWAAAAFTGPLIAGSLTEYWSWRAAFFVNIPAALVFIILVLSIVPRRGGANLSAAPIPVLRVLATGAGILLISISNRVENELGMATLLAAALTMLYVTVQTDRRSYQPVLPSGAFMANSALAAGLWVVLLMPVAQASSSVFLVYVLERLWHLGPTTAGFSSAVMAMSWSVTAILVASLRSKDFRQSLICTGPMLLSAGFAALTLAVNFGRFWAVIPGQIAIGAGFGICWGTLSQLLMEVSPAAERDKTSSLLPTLQSAGYAIGAAFFGLVANARGFGEHASDAALKGAMLAVFGIGCVVATASLFFGLRMMRLAADSANPATT